MGRWVLPDTNKGRDKFRFFIPNYPNSTLICQSYLVYQYHLLAVSFINKQVKSTCCYCFPSICNWWYQGEVAFCCKEGEPCITFLWVCLCLYLSFSSSPTKFRIKSFSKIKSRNHFSFVLIFYGLYHYVCQRKWYLRNMVKVKVILCDLYRVISEWR